MDISELSGLQYNLANVIDSRINSTFFADYGIVKQVNSDKTINVVHSTLMVLINGVTLPQTETSNIEVIFPASASMGMKWPIAAGDGVLLIGLKHYVESTANIQQPVNAPTEFLHYTQDTMKAIPLQTVSSPKVLIEVNSSGNLEISNSNTGGLIKLSNATKSLYTILNNIATHTKSIATNLQSATTINCVPGSPVTFNPGTIAAFTADALSLTNDSTDLAALLEA